MTLTVHNVAGQEVTRLVDQVLDAGSYHVTWDGTDSQGVKVGSGVYVFRMVAGSFAESKRVTLLK